MTILFGFSYLGLQNICLNHNIDSCKQIKVGNLKNN